MQPVSWYINRLSLMSPGELLWRVGQKLSTRLATSPSRNIPRRFDAVGTVLPAWPAPAGAPAETYVTAAEHILSGSFDLFGRLVEAGLPVTWNRDPVSGITAPMLAGHEIDYRDPALVGSARNVWELNRHCQLVTLAQTYAITGNDRYRNGALGLVDSWLRACPCPQGVNWASALECGIRLINWYLASRLLRCWENGREPVEGWLRSIHQHCQFTWWRQSRFSSANNHLVGEMAGVYCAASAWPCVDDGGRWRKGAKQALLREARNQVHADGVTREQAVGYQVFVLQFLVIAGLVGEAHGDSFPEEYWSAVSRMLTFLRSIEDVRGNLPDWGDSDDGMAWMLSPHARARRVLDLYDIERSFAASPDRSPAPAGLSAAAWLARGFPRPAAWRANPRARARSFPDGGYYVLGDQFGEREEVSLVFDAAPLGYLSIAAHGHADCLSFILSLGGERVLIDPGTCCYHEDAVWRSYFRGTAAHNTVRVDGEDQSEAGGPFMWLRKARPTVELAQLEGNLQAIRARHDGYTRLSDPVRHTRAVEFDRGDARIDVIEHLAANAVHRVERLWHFAPDCNVQARKGGIVSIDTPRVHVRMHCADADSIQVLRASHAPRGGWVSPRFGALQPTTTLVCRNRIEGETILKTTFTWKFRAS
jgi:uncharacterized heparinase superfamily protein